MGGVADRGPAIVSSSELHVLAHEVRSPVAALVAIADAYPAADPARRRRLLELAEAAAASLERLLSDAAPASLRQVRLDAGALAVAAAETAALSGALVVSAAEGGLELDGDPGRLRQALDNLIANALGHSPAGCTVSVTAQRKGAAIVIAVADEGEGIRPDDLERVFDPGVRLTEARPGSGLGLTVARAIAQAHGGEVEVESSPGQGSTFRLVLPGAAAAP
jgi:two-component system sensor histidine kinase BaeS